MKIIKSSGSNPQNILVDEDIYEWASRVKWYISSKGYAARWEGEHHVYLHRIILGLKRGDGKQADHGNLDKLDNRRENLRVATPAQNRQNEYFQKHLGKKTSHFKGVYRNFTNKAWIAQIGNNGRAKYLGSFQDEKSAAMTYDREARKIYGEFARTNF